MLNLRYTTEQKSFQLTSPEGNIFDLLGKWLDADVEYILHSYPGTTDRHGNDSYSTGVWPQHLIADQKFVDLRELDHLPEFKHFSTQGSTLNWRATSNMKLLIVTIAKPTTLFRHTAYLEVIPDQLAQMCHEAGIDLEDRFPNIESILGV